MGLARPCRPNQLASVIYSIELSQEMNKLYIEPYKHQVKLVFCFHQANLSEKERQTNKKQLKNELGLSKMLKKWNNVEIK